MAFPAFRNLRPLIIAAGVAAVAAVPLAALVMASPASAADIGRGRILYDSRCTTCHTTGVHTRPSRKATDFAGIRAQVERWNRELGGAWGREEIDDVSVYLNDLYYGYRCPETVCRAGAAYRGGEGGSALVASGNESPRGSRPRKE